MTIFKTKRLILDSKWVYIDARDDKGTGLRKRPRVNWPKRQIEYRNVL